MRLSYVIVTRNRQASLLKTLEILERNTQLPRHAWEVVVVDNASDDGSAEAVSREFRDATVVRLDENEGMPGRNHGFKVARGRYVCLIDDDSYPVGRAVPQALHHLDRHPDTAAVVARVLNPGGGVEAPAFPCVLLGGASVIRKSVLDRVGGFSPEFFRQAEEYDLSFRILAADLRIERFEDVQFLHEKVPGGRAPALVHRMDIRNNLILVERFLPKALRGEYRHDWMRRYGALAAHDGCGDVVTTALHEAHVWARRERSVGRRTLPAAALEAALGLKAQAAAVANWAAATGLRRVAIADFGKNFYATYAACRRANLEPVALVDARPAFAGRAHRGMPVVPSAADARGLGAQGVVIANINPAQIDRAEATVRQAFDGPVLRLWEPRHLEGPAPVTRTEAA